MKNKKGFTLIELLAVIAILALLVVFAVPNVLKLFTDSKKSAFVTQAQSVYKSAEEQIISRQLSNPTASIKRFYSDSGIDKLKLTGTEDVKYCIKVVGNKITSFAIVDGKHYFYKNDISSVSDITGEDNDSYGDGYKILSCDSNGNATLLDVHLTLTGENIIDISLLVVGGSVEKTFSVKNETSSTSYYDIKMSNVYTTFVGDNLVYTLSSTNGGGTTETETIMPNNDGLIKAKISIAGNTTQTYTMTITNKNTGVHPEDYNAGATYTGKIVILTPYTYTNGNADNIELSNRIMLDNTEAPNSNTSSKYVTASSGINYANPSDYAYDGYYTYTETVSFTSDANKQVGTTFSYDTTSGMFYLTGTKTSKQTYSSDHIGQYTCNSSATYCTSDPQNLYKILEVNGSIVTKVERYAPKPKKDTWNGLGLYQTSTNTLNNKTTYFFRGHVVNNYVSFAGDIWRIVRINEDGSIRLIRNSGLSPTSQFNASRDDPMYVGYMFGTSSEPYANTNPPAIKTATDGYYTSSLSSLSSYLADAGFCNDRTINGTNGAKIYYGAYGRLYSNKTPQYACPNVGRDLFTTSSSSVGNKALAYPIGLITLDEVAYAGGVYNKNSKTYINGNANYYTITPFQFVSYSYTYVVSTGGFVTSTSSTSKYYIRPVISLKSDVLVSGGSGSANDPYVITQ